MATDLNSTTEKSTLFQRSFILQAWLGIVLAILFGAALAVVQAAWGPKIEANKINETKSKVPELVLGRQAAEKMAAQGALLTIEPKTVTVDVQGRQKPYRVYGAQYPDGRLAGWVTKAKGMGYADRIELLMAFDPSAGQLTGLFILDQKETPGLGNKIIDQVWRDQFIGKSTGHPLEVVKAKNVAGHQINAISGATISSRSVVAIINTAVNDLKSPLAALAAKRQKE